MTHSLPGGLALSWLQSRDSCPSIGPVWNLFYAEKYLELKTESVIWERLIGTGERPAPYIWHTGPTVSSLMEKNPPDPDNRHKENRFVWSNNTVKCSGLVPLCSLFPLWPRVGKFLISTPRHALFAKSHLANVACVEAVTGRIKPGGYFSKTAAIQCQGSASGCWYGAAGAFWAGPGQSCLLSPASGAHALMEGMTEPCRKHLWHSLQPSVLR